MSISIGIFFTFATYPGTRGHSLKLALLDSRINARSHSFAVSIIIPVWNSLPNAGAVFRNTFPALCDNFRLYLKAARTN